MCGSSLLQALAITVSGSYAYVVRQAGLVVVNVMDKASPSIVGQVNDPSLIYSASGLAVRGQQIFVAADYSSELAVFDVSIPSSPTMISKVSIPDPGGFASGPRAVAISGSYAYVTCGYSKLAVVDVSNVSASSPPTVEGYLILSEGPKGVAVSNSYAYVTGTYSLFVVDVSVKASPSLAGYAMAPWNDPSLFQGACGVAVSGSFAFVAAENSNKLIVVDVSNPAAPSVVGSLSDVTKMSQVHSSACVTLGTPVV